MTGIRIRIFIVPVQVCKKIHVTCDTELCVCVGVNICAVTADLYCWFELVSILFLSSVPCFRKKEWDIMLGMVVQ